jgi:hypothetical protein
MSYGDGVGFNSEEMVKELLQTAGWGVKELRKASDNGRAPMLEKGVPDGDIRVPDFQVHHKDHTPRYVEVKSFNDYATLKVENSDRHGYAKEKHQDYLAFQREASNPVYIFIHERSNGVVLRQKVTHLSVIDTLDGSQAADHYGRDETIVFFERDQFEVVTDHLGGLSAGYAQDGLIKENTDIAPFGLATSSGPQTTLTGGGF